MTSPVYICDPDTPLDELAEAITSRRIRHIPVVKDGLLRGIITSGDILAQQFMESREQLVYLNEYIHGV
jgi:signal-transduction protein with cAMP-binding, CBS, and nucleotidyltransferase domain